MIRFSKREDYAVILISKLAENYKKRLVSLSEIAKEYSISLLFLRNIANDLRVSGVVRALEGKNGGYALVHNPKTLKMGKILPVFSKDSIIKCCSFTKKSLKNHREGKCPKQGICKPGYIWRKINKDFLDKISSLSVAEFLLYK